MEFFKFSGTKEQLFNKTQEFGLNAIHTEKILAFLLKNKHKLNAEEFVNTNTSFPKIPEGFMGMMFAQTNYNINLKVVTIAIVALILDITLTEGIASTLLTLSGLSRTAIVELQESNGEKCIVKETILSDNKMGNKNILSQFYGECCNNNINCSFRKIDKCTCKEENVIEIYERLTNSGVFNKKGVYYKYQW